VLQDREFLRHKARPLTSKNQLTRFVTTVAFVTDARIVGCQLAKGIFAIILDHSRGTYLADPLFPHFRNGRAVYWRKCAIRHSPQVVRYLCQPLLSFMFRTRLLTLDDNLATGLADHYLLDRHEAPSVGRNLTGTSALVLPHPGVRPCKLLARLGGELLTTAGRDVHCRRVSRGSELGLCIRASQPNRNRPCMRFINHALWVPALVEIDPALFVRVLLEVVIKPAGIIGPSGVLSLRAGVQRAVGESRQRLM